MFYSILRFNIFFSCIIFLTYNVAFAQKFLSSDDAIKIALKHAKFASNTIEFIDSEKEFDKGVPQYEITFWKENVKYEYKIDARSGSINKYSEERRKTSFVPINPNDPLLSIEDAKKISLQHAKLNENIVRFVKISQEFEYGYSSYELRFWKENTEYFYEIDSATGDILDFYIKYH